MSDSVKILISMPQLVGNASEFPLGNFSTLVSSFDPKGAEIVFRCDPALGTDIEIDLEFSEESHSSSIKLISEALIRSETKMGYECSVVENQNGASALDNQVCLYVTPELATLPSSKKIAVSVPLLGVVNDVFRQSRTIGSIFSYKVTLCRTEGDDEKARLLIPAIAELRTSSRDHTKLEQVITRSYELAKKGGWLAYERFCTNISDVEQDKLWIEPLVRSHLNSEYGFLDDELLPILWSQEPVEDYTDSFQQHFGQLRGFDYFKNIFDSVVPSNSNKLLSVSAPASVQQMGKKELENGRYAFVSYSHKDTELATTIRGILDDSGITYWYDAAIAPGTVWDEQLEQKIRNCGVFIACVSDRYQDSKYCRRELKFADLAEKPIFAVSANEWTWGVGLKLMFQELQVTSINTPGSKKIFSATIRDAVPFIAR